MGKVMLVGDLASAYSLFYSISFHGVQDVQSHSCSDLGGP